VLAIRLYQNIRTIQAYLPVLRVIMRRQKNGRIELSQEAEDYLLSVAKKRTVSKGSVLIRQGQEVDKVYFVTDGCLRSYCIDKKGKDHTLQFSIKNGWISDYIAIHTQVPAVLTVECLKEASLIELSTEETAKLLALFPEYEPYQS